MTMARGIASFSSTTGGVQQKEKPPMGDIRIVEGYPCIWNGKNWVGFNWSHMPWPLPVEKGGTGCKRLPAEGHFLISDDGGVGDSGISVAGLQRLLWQIQADHASLSTELEEHYELLKRRIFKTALITGIITTTLCIGLMYVL